MRQQNVFRLKSRNGFEGIQVSQEPIPTPSRHELLIRVRSVALNYRDIAISTSKYPFPVKDDLVPCSDAMGEVVDMGSGVEGFAIGDKVVVAFDPTAQYGTIDNWDHALGGPVDGVLAEHIAIPWQGVVKLPQSTISDAQWAAIVCTGVTAWNCLFGNIALKPGQTVLLQGTGGVSITALILAKAAGARTIITSSSDDKLKYVKENFGADETINYKSTPDWGSEAKRLTGGRGVDFVIENGGSGTIEQSISAVAFGGNISVVGFLSQAPQEKMPDVASLALSKGCIVRGIIIGSKQQLEDVVRFVGVHDLKLPVQRTFPFSREGFIDAARYMTSGQHIGKVCITI